MIQRQALLEQCEHFGSIQAEAKLHREQVVHASCDKEADSVTVELQCCGLLEPIATPVVDLRSAPQYQQ